MEGITKSTAGGFEKPREEVMTSPQLLSCSTHLEKMLSHAPKRQNFLTATDIRNYGSSESHCINDLFQ